MDKSSYGPGVYVSTGRSAEGNEPGYGSSHHTWWKRFQFTLSYSQAATKAVCHRAGPRTALCFKVISILPNFCNKQIYFKTSQPPHQLPQNNSEVIRKSVTWKTLQDSGTYFFFSSKGELHGKKKKKRKNTQQTEEVGLSSFSSPGYCAFLSTLKGCQINVFPTESQAFTGNSCVCMKIILTVFCLYTTLFHARISARFIK